ncbi:ATP-dependent (S)-NAD(P)H-hydrate dehydratase [Symmachiella macrocystis]|uniref:ADP-dependent (S)-NAD(P)H-hydrate dehydratase n=1 Tax=Symmachiella macrocystis TaxID=2527985 RepID=A0A5C6BW26_9PLAN|nr:NAD(P)H-hydrate dehydratase [Symmachiella macrocystis]TWU14934.1 ATP-dependent (S)-NAD(P)H-hydrate dehydratase [Symmachiella macrocystis]
MALERVTELPELPARKTDSHKGSFGRVLLIAGSRGMSGAACLSGMGALRGGAGLVFVAVPSGIVSIVAGREPSYLNIPLPEDEAGRLHASATETLQDEVTKPDVIAIGPGCGQSQAVTDIVTWLYRDIDKPLVVDADGLNALSTLDTLPPAAGPRILTPHPGEFARLTRTDIKTVQQAREEMATEFAAAHGCVVLLKGAGTIITDGHRVAVNSTGNSGMATGGSGDVLTGLIAALLAQGLPVFEAAQLAAHLHGLAGDLAAAELSEPGLIASDLPRYLPAAWLRVLAK